MTFDEADIDVVVPSPGSPPGMTASKSSKSSSFQSFHSDDNSVLADVSHFEEIGLDDDAVHFDSNHLRETQFKIPPNPYSPSFSTDLRSQAQSVKFTPPPPPRSRSAVQSLSNQSRQQSSLSPNVNSRPPYPSLKSQVRHITTRSSSLNAYPDTYRGTVLPVRGLASHSTTSLPYLRRPRSQSPGLTLCPRDPSLLVKPRRSSWQSNQERKSAADLERECDEDDGDDIPDDLILENVPISPRPPEERFPSRAASPAPPTSRSPERQIKERIRSVGNGTPPVAMAQGSLRSPSWKSDSDVPSVKSDPPSPIKARAKSWNAALAKLSAEAKVLTEKLEEHADEETARKSANNGISGNSGVVDRIEPRRQVKSAIAELPPLRRSNIMIDPLPISREKEAVLSRTRPSWLPPKDPSEERRHLKEYQRMMAQSLEADRRREAARRARSACRDTAADSLMRLWEEDIIPRWNVAVRERRTKDLWWQGVAPRSRGAVWGRAIGNELGLTENSFVAALKRAKEAEVRIAQGDDIGLTPSADDQRYAESLRAIQRDVNEDTWTDLKIFQAGGPQHEPLVDILSAYSMYRSDIGYAKGINTIAALLLLNLPNPASAFIALANVLNRPLPLSFLTLDPGAKASAYNLLLQTLESKCPAVYSHLRMIPDANPDIYIGNCFSSLFTGANLRLDEISRLWDIYVFEGDAALIRAGVALLTTKEMELLGTSTVEEIIQVLNGCGLSHGRPRSTGGLCSSEEEAWVRALKEAGRS